MRMNIRAERLRSMYNDAEAGAVAAADQGAARVFCVASVHLQCQEQRVCQGDAENINCKKD